MGSADKLAIARALWAIRREHGTRQDLDRITMLDWLREKRQTERAIRRFWNQVLVSAINEDLDRMAASHGFQVFWLGFLGARECVRDGDSRGAAGRSVRTGRLEAHPECPAASARAGGASDRRKTARFAE